MPTAIYARQGDLVIDKLQSPISGELEKAKQVTFAGDSSGHPHRIVGEVLLRKEGRRTLVRLSEPRTLEHGRAGGHKPVTLEAGDYAITPLRERGDAGDRSVED
jgi:hypothetical protein